MAGRALVTLANSPPLAWPQINRAIGGKSIVLDAACSTEYDNSARGRVKDPVILPDFKTDLEENQHRRLLPCWTVSSLFFLHLSILMLLSRLG